MSLVSRTLFALALVLIIISPMFTNAHRCSDAFSFEIREMNISQHCYKKTLRTEFAWNFDNKSRSLEIAFGARLDTDSGWLGWGLNLQGRSMVGTRALIGIKQHNNNTLECNKYLITEATKYGCPLSSSHDIGLKMRNFTFIYLEKIDFYVLRASVYLPYDFNSSATNVVWQVGELVANGVPLMHPKTLEHLDTAETIDLITGKVKSHTAHERLRLRTAHGVLNIVGWGTLIPAGVIISRYFRRFPVRWYWWFVFHVSFQSAGFVLGSIGFALGLWLGNTSKYYCFHTHKILAIIIFTFTTIQMLALRLRPSFSDEYRRYWNMYHHALGYALLAAISVNIFEGIKILKPFYIWKWAYIGVLGSLGGVALALEIYTWIKFLLQKGGPIQDKRKPSPNNHQMINMPPQQINRSAQGSGRSTVQPQT